MAGTIVPTTMLNLVSDLSFVYLANLAKLNYHRICYLSLLYTLHRYLFEHFFSGHMMLVAEDSNKVVAFKSYSRQCSLCARNGLKEHNGPCNNSYNGTAKSMEPVGMVDCIKDVASRGGNVTELIVDNDGNTLEAIQVMVADYLLLCNTLL